MASEYSAGQGMLHLSVGKSFVKEHLCYCMCICGGCRCLKKGATWNEPASCPAYRGRALLGGSRHGGYLRNAQAGDIRDHLHLARYERDGAGPVRIRRLRETLPLSGGICPECGTGASDGYHGSGWLFLALSRIWNWVRWLS